MTRRKNTLLFELKKDQKIKNNLNLQKCVIKYHLYSVAYQKIYLKTFKSF